MTTNGIGPGAGFKGQTQDRKRYSPKWAYRGQDLFAYRLFPKDSNLKDVKTEIEELLRKQEPTALFVVCEGQASQIEQLLKNSNNFSVYSIYRGDARYNSDIVAFVHDMTSGVAPIVEYNPATDSTFSALWLKVNKCSSTGNNLQAKAGGSVVYVVIHQKSATKANLLPLLDYVGKSYKTACDSFPMAEFVLQGDLKLDRNTLYTSCPELDFSKLSTSSFQFQDDDAVITYLMNVSAGDKPKTFRDFPGCFALSLRRDVCCFICNEYYATEAALQDHKRQEQHIRNYYAWQYLRQRTMFKESKLNMEFLYQRCTNKNAVAVPQAEDKHVFVFHVLLETESTLIFSIKNMATAAKEQNNGVILRLVQVIDQAVDTKIRVTDDYGLTLPPTQRPASTRTGGRLLPGRKLDFKVVIPPKATQGQERVPIVARIQRENDKHSEESVVVMGMELVLLYTSSFDDVADMKPEKPFEEKPRTSRRRKDLKASDMRQYARGGANLRGRLGGSIKTPKPRYRLPEYPLPTEFERVLDKGFSADQIDVHHPEADFCHYSQIFTQPLNEDTYSSKFSHLLYAEEYQLLYDIRNYDMHNVTMGKSGSDLTLEVPGLAENRPSVLKGDEIYVRPKGYENACFKGLVIQVMDTKVRLAFEDRLLNIFQHGMKFDVQFTFNKFPLHTMHRAIRLAQPEKDGGLLDQLFPNLINQLKLPSASSTAVSEPKNGFFDRNIGTNPKQKLAVCRIVSKSLSSLPYIVFGPPGTGKTVTLVEAIKQIYKYRPDVNILACAPSNSAADLLTSRLLSTVAKGDILRLYSSSRDPVTVPEQIFEVTSFKKPVEELFDITGHRIVVCTLVTAGRLVTYGVPQGHFGYFFIDEAGHAMEPEGIIPIAGLFDPPTSKLILAGDPKQLGPIIHSTLAIKFNLNVSLIERLMNGFGVYKRSLPVDSPGEYDSRFITKLEHNFRSHKLLLEVPSRLFYESELVPKADVDMVSTMLSFARNSLNEGRRAKKMALLPSSAEVPLIFRGVAGDDTREGDSPSFFNVSEVELVVSYVQQIFDEMKRIKGSDIGIISPYRRQIVKIRKLLKNRFSYKLEYKEWENITVGSTEEFQGQERRIIIISTVRSREEFLKSDYKHKLGFLKNEKRFNVAITRSKALLIIVGNPNLLKGDPHWRELIDHAVKIGGYDARSIEYRRPSAPGPAQKPSSTLNGDAAPLPDALSSFLASMKALNLVEERSASANDQSDEDLSEGITERELQEAPEWRADY